MTRLVQITKLKGEIPRVRRGETPVIELALEPNQQVVSVDLRPNRLSDFQHERKTVDWDWTAYVVTPL